MTLTQKLIESVSAAAKVNRALMVSPAAILWTDAERHWESVIPQLAKQLPELFVLGDYAPEDRQGRRCEKGGSGPREVRRATGRALGGSGGQARGLALSRR